MHGLNIDKFAGGLYKTILPFGSHFPTLWFILPLMIYSTLATKSWMKTQLGWDRIWTCITKRCGGPGVGRRYQGGPPDEGGRGRPSPKAGRPSEAPPDDGGQVPRPGNHRGATQRRWPRPPEPQGRVTIRGHPPNDGGQVPRLVTIQGPPPTRVGAPGDCP